jgi:preprotein translocase subunit SecG
MQTLFVILQIVFALLLVFIVLVQEGKDPGMRGIVGGSSENTDSFFKQNTGRTKKAMLSKITVALSVLFLITTMTLVFMTA